MESYLRVQDKGEILVENKGVLNAIQIGNMIVLVNPSEVLANDDNLTFDIQAKGKIITDQAYTKVLSNSNVKINVKMELDDSSYFPHPVLLYNNANLQMNTEIHVKGKSVIVETFILGRRGSGERFTKGKIRAITKIYFGEEMLVYDIFRVNDEDHLDLIGYDSLLTVYEIGNEKATVKREKLSYKRVFQRWKEITGVWF